MIDVDLGAHRDVDTREDPTFFKKVTEVREALRSHELGLVGPDDVVRAVEDR